MNTKHTNIHLQSANLEYATDTWFSTVKSYEGYNCAQVFYGTKSMWISQYGMQSEGDGPSALLDFFRKEGVPISIRADNSKMQTSALWKQYLRRYNCNDGWIEPYNSWQNPAERALATHKNLLDKMLMITGCDLEAWFKLSQYICGIQNRLAKEKLDWRTSYDIREGETPDITPYLLFMFWELVYYYEPKNVAGRFPNTKEGVGRWLGVAENHGDTMSFWILKLGGATPTLIIRGTVRRLTDGPMNRQLLPKTIQDEIAES